MKIILSLLCLVPFLCFGTTVEYREIDQLKTREVQLKALLAEIRWLYRDEREFIAAFDTAQKKWEEYSSAMLAARFPVQDKRAYGSVYELAYAAVKRGLIETRIREISLWSDGTEEGDVSAGSVKRTTELEEIRRKQKK